MKMKDVRQLTSEEVAQRLVDAKEELFNLKFQLATHQLDNQVKVRLVRRDVARLTTVLKEFEKGIRKNAEKADKS